VPARLRPDRRVAQDGVREKHVNLINPERQSVEDLYELLSRQVIDQLLDIAAVRISQRLATVVIVARRRKAASVEQLDQGMPIEAVEKDPDSAHKYLNE
jgi:hypothetical protein